MQETRIQSLGWKDPLKKGTTTRPSTHSSLVAQLVKSLPAVWETQVQSLGWENPLEKGMSSTLSVFLWENSMERGAWQATVHWVAKS